MPSGDPQVFQFGPFRLDLRRRLLERDGEPVQLSGKALDILVVLLRRRGELVDKEALLREVWPDTIVEENNLTVNISGLRKALGESVANPLYLITVPGRGYRFVAEAAPVVLESPAPATTVSGSGFPIRRAAAAALLLCGVAVAAWWVRVRMAPKPIHSIAVLPFRVLNPDPANEHLGLGLTAALITRLGSLQQTAIRPLDSSIKAAAKGTIEAGKAMGVDTVIEGNVETDENRVRLNVHMLRVQDGASIWAEHFDEDQSNLFTLEDSISARVAASVMRKISPGSQNALAKSATRNGEAYANYLRGRYYASRYTEDGFRKGLAYLQAAIASDPDYALAYSGLADAYYDASNLLLPPTEAMPKAKAAAQKAAALEPSLAAAHVSLGLVASKYDWNWPEADKEFQMALMLDPNSAAAHQWYGLYRAQLGDSAHAIASLRRAQELDPLSSDISSYLSTAMFWARRFDEALDQGRKTTSFDPNFVPGYVGSCWALEALMRVQEAVQACAQANTIDSNPWTLLNLARANALAGNRAAAQVTLDGLRKQPGFVSGYDLAVVNAALGKTDQAFASLEDAYTHRAEWLSYSKVDPQLDALRTDPRFTSLMRRMNLN